MTNQTTSCHRGAPVAAVAMVRGLACLSLLALLSACAGHQAPIQTATQEAAVYKARAKSTYAPPGTPEDPWGPYIIEASRRFDVPEPWIREVMHIESGGHLYRADGTLITSQVGAMGLMQVMPGTYDELKERYNLGDDAFDPHNNILAGTAYVREMYDTFGNPGFLAAYNGGPARLEDYLTHNRPLPAETRRYVAMIGPHIQGIYPNSRSPADMYAVNQLPINIPAGPRYVRYANVAVTGRNRHGQKVLTRYASLTTRRGHAPAAPMPIEIAEAPDFRGQDSRTLAYRVPEPHAQPHTAIRLASAPAHRGGLHLIDSAMAAENVPHTTGSNWAVQVGAFGNAGQARAAAGAAHGVVGRAQPVVATFHDGRGTFYRARLSGMTHDGAVQACQKLSHSRTGCIVVSPAAS